MTELRNGRVFPGLLRHGIVLFAAACVIAANPITITVNPGNEKTFGGYGVTVDNVTTNGMKAWPEAERDRLGQMLWVDAGFKHIRIWAHDGGDLESMTSEVGDEILWYVKEVKERHRPDLEVILGPCQNNITGVEQYSDFYVGMIRKLKEEYDFQLDGTGVVNEPNAKSLRFNAGTLPSAVKAFRRKLDAIGMENVKIIAPEVSNVDAGGYAYGNALRGDAQAWEQLDGFGTHSYGIAMTKDMMDIVTRGKDHYMTESSGSDTHTAAKALSDVNLGVTHWYFFFGYRDAAECGGGTYCLLPVSGGTGTPLGKFHVLKEYSQTLEPGTRLRFCETNLSGEVNQYMECNRVKGPLPPISCVAGVNPKGAWVIALSNNSGYSTSGQYGWAGSPRATYDVTVSAEELNDEASLEFTVKRIAHGGGQLGESAVTMNNGRLVLPGLDPQTSAVLRAKRSTEEPVATIARQASIRASLAVTVAGSVVHIEHETGAAGNLQATLYALSGRPLRKVAVDNAAAGGHSIVLDARGVADGTYLVRVGQANHWRTARIVLGR